MRARTLEPKAPMESVVFAAHRRATRSGEDNMPGSDETEWLPTRESLLSRLKETSADESWREFFETYWKLIYSNARRAGLTNNEAQDVVQETMIALNTHIHSFRVNSELGSFKTWLWHITRSKIVDQLRHRRKDEVIEEALRREVEEKVQVSWDNEWQLNVAEEALRRVQNQANPRMVQAFATYVIQGKPMAETTKLLEMNAAAVYVACMRMKRLIKKEAEKIQKGQI